MSLSKHTTSSQPPATPLTPEERRSVLQDFRQKLVQSGVAEQALKTGDLAPAFALPNAVGKSVSSEELLRKGPLVVSFYRGAWCSYCNLELHALQVALARIHELGAELVAISPNFPDNSMTSIEKHSLTYEVLTDAQNRVARQYNLVITLSEEVKNVYNQNGLDIPAHNGDDSWQLPIPATYVIASSGEIVFSFVTADHSQRAETADILAALESLR